MLLMIQYVMYVAPVGVFCLLASLVGEQGLSVVTSALSYLGVTALGVVILIALFILVIWVRTRLNVVRLAAKLAEQTVIAITTTSSAVAFPTVLRNAVEKVGVSQRVANFTLSIGLTMGPYGAVLNYMIVVMFLAQAGNVDLSLGQIVLGVFLSIMLNMGTITVPGGFPVVAMFLATSLDLPIEAVGLLLAVEWFTGILRTFLNVNRDTFVAMLVAHSEKEIDHDVYHGRKTVDAEMDGELPKKIAGDEPKESTWDPDKSSLLQTEYPGQIRLSAEVKLPEISNPATTSRPLAKHHPSYLPYCLSAAVPGLYPRTRYRNQKTCRLTYFLKR